MTFFKRTVSALALGAALALPAALVAPALVPAAMAQDTAEARFAELMRLYGAPDGLLKWDSVEETGSGYIAHGFRIDLTGRNAGLTEVPLGDFEVTSYAVENSYVTELAGRFSSIKADLAQLMTAGQTLGQTPSGATVGMGLAMMAGYVQGLGYQTLDISASIESRLDLGTGQWAQAGTLSVADAFSLDFTADLANVTAAYVDWARENGAKMLLDPVAGQAEAEAAAADPNSPLARVGYSGFSLLFDDEGLMARLEPQLAQARAGMLGVNADGTPKTELTDADLMVQATAMAGAGGVTPEKLLPLVKAIYGFVMKPDVIAVAVRIDPALTISEFRSLTPQPGATAAPAAPAVDWNSRLTIDAHN